MAERRREDPDRPSREEIESRLRRVVDPCSASRGTNHDIVEMGLLRSIDLDGRDVTVSMRLTSPGCLMVGRFEKRIREEVGDLAGVESVSLETDGGLDWRPEMMSDEARRRREEYLDRLERHYESSGETGEHP